MKKTIVMGFMAICVILGLTSCDDKVNDDAVKWKYLAVQFEENGNWYVVDEMGNEVENAVYPPEAKISQVYDGAYWVLLNDTFRLYSVTSPTEPVNGAVYDCVTDFAAGRALVANVGEPIKIINTKGKVKKELPQEYVRVSKFSEDGVAVVDYQHFLSSQKNVINRKGKNLLSDVDSYGLETIYPSHDGAMLSIDTLYGKFKVFDLKGQELCRLSPLEYQTGESRRLRPDYNEGLLCLRMKEERNMVGYVDRQGQLQFTVKSYSGCNNCGFRDGYAVINDNSQTIIDKTGNVVFETPYRRWYWVKNVGNGRFAGMREDSGLHVDVFDTQGNVLFTMDGSNDYNKCTFGDKFLLQHDGYRLYDAQGKLLNEKPFYAVSDYCCPEFVDYLDVADVLSFISQKINEVSLNVDIMDWVARSEMGLRRASNSKGVYVDSIVNNIPLSFGYIFDDYLVTEVSRDGYTPEGWRKKIVEGYKPNDIEPECFNLLLKLKDMTIDCNKLAPLVVARLKSEGFEMNEDNYLHRERDGIALDIKVKSSESSNYNEVSIKCWIERTK